MIQLAQLASRVGTLANQVGTGVKTAFAGTTKTVARTPGMRTVHQPGAIKRILEAGWQVDALNNFVDSHFPSVAIVVEVDVLGSPLSTKFELYYLALSIAFGVIDYTIISTTTNTIEVMIDHTGKHVRVKMTQSYAGFFDNVKSVNNSLSGNQQIRLPPKKDIKADTWPPFLQSSNTLGGRIDNNILPAKGTLLISEDPAPNYQPVRDNGSTENDLVNLITAALLGQGCSNPENFPLSVQMEKNQKVNPVIR